MVRHCLWKMFATYWCMHQTGFSSAAVMPQSKFTELYSSAAVLSQSKFTSCVARQPLCHKVNLPKREARRQRRRHLTMTCDIFGTGQTNTSTLCYLMGKTYKSAHSSTTLESLKSTRSTNCWKSYLREPHTRSIEGFDRVSAKFDTDVKAFKPVNSM